MSIKTVSVSGTFAGSAKDSFDASYKNGNLVDIPAGGAGAAGSTGGAGAYDSVVGGVGASDSIVVGAGAGIPY